MEENGYLVGVVALIQREDGKVLMGLRPKEQVWAGFGGKLSANEMPLDGLRREVREELGVELATVEPIGFDWGRTPKDQPFAALYFRVTLAPGVTPHLQEAHAADAMRWMDPADLPFNVWERERAALRRLMAMPPVVANPA